MINNLALIVPLANEADTIDSFTHEVALVLDTLQCNCQVFLIVDEASKDCTLELCYNLSRRDCRFVVLYAPENRNVVDAYLRGYKEAIRGNFDYVIEMDGGLSHDPRAIPMFIRNLSEGHDCVFGCRFMNGGSIFESNWKRTFLSKSGTILSNVFLGTRMKDMTSGFMGFRIDMARKFVEYGLLSKAHFYQTEVRYLLRNAHCIEVPIHYKAPSPRVSKKAIYNSFEVLFHYFFLRLKGCSVSLIK